MDDEEDIVLVCKTALSARYDVEGFSDSEEAAEQFRSDPHAYDLVLTDVKMPGLNGFELARYLRDIRKEVPIIFMTAHDLDAAEYNSLLPWLSPSDILTKPVRMHRLLEMVDGKIRG